MLQSLLNAWKLPDLRSRLLFTAFVIALYRFGSYVPVPGVDLSAIQDLIEGGALKGKSAGDYFRFLTCFCRLL